MHPVTGLPVKGPVVIAGAVSPGNSPGRIRINCDLTMLAGSKLILEIDDNGASFDVDQLIIGNDSNFDLNSLQIIFSFIGDTRRWCCWQSQAWAWRAAGAWYTAA